MMESEVDKYFLHWWLQPGLNQHLDQLSVLNIHVVDEKNPLFVLASKLTV